MWQPKKRREGREGGWGLYLDRAASVHDLENGPIFHVGVAGIVVVLGL